MSITQTEKDYWIQEIRETIGTQIKALIADSPYPNMIKEAEQESVRRAVHLAGADEEEALLETLRAERDVQKHALDELERRISNLDSARWEKLNKIFNVNRWNSNSDKLEKVYFKEALKDCFGETGIQVGALYDLSQNVERRIMLTTSAPDLRAFLESTFIKIGQPLN